MTLVTFLQSKNVKVVEIHKWGPYLRAQWARNFADHLSGIEKELIEGYLWHLFSYEKKACLTGTEAISEFYRVLKNECYVFYQHSDYALLIENLSSVSSNDFINKDECNEGDVYLVDKEFNWTFVKTHERMYGPYFSRKKD